VIIKINVARFVLFAYLLAASLLVAGVANATESYEVIINATVNEKTLPKTSLRAIFGMRLHTWPDGTAIKVFVMPDDAPLHAAFSKEKLNVFPYQLRSAWDRLVFSGTGQAPETVNSPEDMLAKVASTPGAIGYLPKSRMDGRVNVLQIK
jgi:ABC-type phosphate transport system substrate-binding protein